MAEPVKVMMVCLGNICRSPMAEGVLRDALEKRGWSHRMTVDSSGTSGEHDGEDADPRTLRVLKKHGIELNHCSKRFSRSDFNQFDWILVMDSSNFRNVSFMAEEVSHRSKVRLITDFDQGNRFGVGVKDPWDGDLNGFEEVYEQLSHCVDGFLFHVFGKSNKIES